MLKAKYIDKTKIIIYTSRERKECSCMNSDRETLLGEALNEQRIIIALIKQKVGFPFFLELDMSMAQFKGLFILAQHPRGTVGQFADTLHIGRSAASLLVDRLVQDGLAERTEDTVDRRKMVLCLSPRGEELVALFQQGRVERDPLPAWLEKLSEDDLGALVQGLRALTGIAQDAMGVIGPWHTSAVKEGSSSGSGGSV
jgi:DNA-binding MarR family transcriptional regulator